MAIASAIRDFTNLSFSFLAIGVNAITSSNVEITVALAFIASTESTA